MGEKYFEALGKRKNARARVRLFAAARMSFDINGRLLEKYFPTSELQILARAPLAHTGEAKYKVSGRLSGGGLRGQAEALALGIARALLKADPNLKGALRKEHMLSRDSRIKERRKFGLKKARKAPQWSKR